MYEPIKLRVSNIPIINLRKEFENYLALFNSAKFKEKLFDFSSYPIEISFLSWSGMPHDLITLMLQRSILGIEAYIFVAVDYELRSQKLLSTEVQRYIDKPFSLNRKVVVALYEKLPELVAPEYKLSCYNQSLYQQLSSFYENIRNPLFHGYQVDFSAETYDQVVRCFELLENIYSWIDSWHSAFPSLSEGNKPTS